MPEQTTACQLFLKPIAINRRAARYGYVVASVHPSAFAPGSQKAHLGLTVGRMPSVDEIISSGRYCWPLVTSDQIEVFSEQWREGLVWHLPSSGYQSILGKKRSRGL